MGGPLAYYYGPVAPSLHTIICPVKYGSLPLGTHRQDPFAQRDTEQHHMHPIWCGETRGALRLNSTGHYSRASCNPTRFQTNEPLQR